MYDNLLLLQPYLLFWSCDVPIFMVFLAFERQEHGAMGPIVCIRREVLCIIVM